MDERRNRVTLCNNGQKTVEIFEKNPQQFDLVLSDMEMPKMTGKQLATALFEIRPNLPIILSSGYSTTMSNDIAKAMGIVSYSAKPVKLSELSREIDSCLRKSTANLTNPAEDQSALDSSAKSGL